MPALNSVIVDFPCVNRYSLTVDAARSNRQEMIGQEKTKHTFVKI